MMPAGGKSMRLKLTSEQRQLLQDLRAYDPNASDNYLRSIHDFQSGRPWSPTNYSKRERRVSDEQIKRMRSLRENHWTVNEIANYLDVCPLTVNRHIGRKQ